MAETKSPTAGWSDDELLDEAREIESGLSEWEVEFVDSLLLRRREHAASRSPARQGYRWMMTGRQRAKLREILDGREGES